MKTVSRDISNNPKIGTKYNRRIYVYHSDNVWITQEIARLY